MEQVYVESFIVYLVFDESIMAEMGSLGVLGCTIKG